jgi:hypothetical protein
MLGGLILLNFAPDEHNTWESFDQLEALGLKREEYDTILFTPLGVSSEVGLTSAGNSKNKTPIFA